MDNANIMFIIFFIIFAILLLIIGYIVYDYYSFKNDINDDIKMDLTTLSEIKTNFQKYKSTFEKLCSLVKTNKQKITSLITNNNDIKKNMNLVFSEQEKKIKNIDILLKTFQRKIADFEKQSDNQKSSIVRFNTEKEILKEFQDIDDEVRQRLNTLSLTKKQISQILSIFNILNSQHRDSLKDIVDNTIEINTVLLELFDNNDEIQKLIQENINTFTDVNDLINQSNLNSFVGKNQINDANLTDLVSKFSQNLNETTLLQQTINYTRNVMKNIDEELINITENTQFILSKMDDLDLQASTFQSRLDVVEAELDNIRSSLTQFGVDIDLIESQIQQLQQKNNDLSPIISTIQSNIRNKNSRFTTVKNQNTNLEKTFSDLQDTASRTQSNNENIETNNDVSNFDRVLKYAFNFKQAGEEITNNLYTNAFSNDTTQLNLNQKTNMNKGLTIQTSTQKPMKICKADSNDCFGFDVSETGTNSTGYPTDAEAQCYLDRYRDLQTALGTHNIQAAKEHWVSSGRSEGRSFSCGNSDFAITPHNNATNFTISSINDGKDYIREPTDDELQCYLDRYPDLRKQFGPKNIKSARNHWIYYGKKDGRSFKCDGASEQEESQELSDEEAQCYLDKYSDLQSIYGPRNITAAKEHWKYRGKSQGRSYSCGSYKMANFDLQNDNIYLGGFDDNATMTIKDGKIVFKNLVLNGKVYCGTFLPTLVATDVTNIFAGGNHTVIIKTDKTTNACGQNTKGQLGTGANNMKNVNPDFTKMLLPSSVTLRIVQIGSSYYSTYFLTNTGKVYSVGNNNYGQLGDGSTSTRSTPYMINFSSDVIVRLAENSGAYNNHMQFITDSGRVYGCGNNSWNQLSYGSTSNQYYPRLARFSNGNEVSGVIQVSCSWGTSLYLTYDGKAYGSGYGGMYMLGRYYTYSQNYCSAIKDSSGNQLSDIVQVTAAHQGSFFVNNSGNVYTCGYNYYYGLSAQNGWSYITDPTLVRFSNGSVLSDVIQVKANSYYSSVFLTNSGRIYAQGYHFNSKFGRTYSNYYLQEIFSGNQLEKIVSIELDYYTLKMLTIDGKVYGTGYNSYGVLGNRISVNVTTFDPILVQIYNSDDLSNIIQIHNGYSGNSSWYLKNDGKMYSVGYNYHGQLGDGSTSNKTYISESKLSFIDDSVEVSTNAKQVACGESHSLIVSEQEMVFGTGDNTYGQITNSTDKRHTPDHIYTIWYKSHALVRGISYVACGQNHSIFVTKGNGLVYGCGNNSKGQLGVNNSIDKYTIPVRCFIINVEFVACGNNHSVFLKKDKTVYSCGHNNVGQLGIGNNSDIQEPKELTINNVKKLDCGGNHTVLIRTDNSVYSCGNNNSGQLGINNTTNTNTPTIISSITNVKDVKCGQEHSVFLKNDGTVYTCGQNSHGQLGIGHNVNKNIPVKVSIDGISQIACGNKHTIILKNDKTAHSFGYNENGQLGYVSRNSYR